MGQVVPFIARLRDSGDWTAVERARLQELADRLASNGVHVEVIFGATDEGDPWCVVTDEGGDVLIHVARIDGKFVVHSAVDDAVNENVDLHSALRDSLAATEDAATPRSATILPFGLTARQGQTFLALLAATTFFYETASIGDTADAAEPLHPLPDQDPPPPPADADEAAQDRETVAQGAALQPAAATAATTVAAGPVAATATATSEAPTPQDAAPAPDAPAEILIAAAPAPKAQAPQAAPEPEFKLIEGTDGDDRLVGAAADEHLVGGDGNDTLIGGGGRDLLEGGAGDDVIHVTSQSVAIGGSGADTFLIQAPVQLGRAETLLGVIADFNRGEGDRIFNWAGENVRLVPHRPPGVDDKSAPPTSLDQDRGDFTTLSPPGTNTRDGAGDFGAAGGNGPATLGPTSGFGPGPGHTMLTRVDVDLDGDGVMDGFLLLAPLDGKQLDSGAFSEAGRLGELTRFDVDLDGDGAADGYIMVGPRGVSEMTLTQVGASFSHADPFA